MSVASFAAIQLVRVLPRKRMSRVVGRLCEAQLPPALSRAVVSLYARAYGVKLSESPEEPAPYSSFDAFFTRPLLPGARAVCTRDEELACPADGRLDAIGPVDAAGQLTVKGRGYSVTELVGDDDDAARYRNGEFAVVYLSPGDYHRVHSPVAGQITLVRSMPGNLYPVNSIGERHIPSLFARNRRVAIVIDTVSQGRITVVMVGAIIVGRITVTGVDAPDVPLGHHSITPPISVAKGDELGIFHLGSTAIVFVEPNAARPLRRATGPVRMGQSLAGAP